MEKRLAELLRDATNEDELLKLADTFDDYDIWTLEELVEILVANEKRRKAGEPKRLRRGLT